MTNRSLLELSVIIPAYNEEKRLPKTLAIVSRFLEGQDLSYEIIVVDDGSGDKTKEVTLAAKIPNLRYVTYGHNRGKGFAVHFGVECARGNWILFTDADNSTPIEEFAKLWRSTDRYEVIIGSRYRADSHVAVKQARARIILSRLGNLLVQLLILPGLKDTQCGFKLFSHAAAKKIFARQTIWAWGFDMEILRIAKELGYQIKEVGVTWYNDEQTRLQSSRVFTRTLGELFRIRLNSWRGIYGRR